MHDVDSTQLLRLRVTGAWALGQARLLRFDSDRFKQCLRAPNLIFEDEITACEASGF